MINKKVISSKNKNILITSINKILTSTKSVSTNIVISSVLFTNKVTGYGMTNFKIHENN